MVALFSVAIVGCGRAIPDAQAASTVPPKLEQAFAVIEELRMGSYLIDPECVYIGYSRGAFSTDVSKLQCWVVTYGNPKRMDPTAERDFERVRDTFVATGVDVDYIGASFDESGRVRAGSFFDVGACSYTYEPGWSTLPIADGIDVEEGAYIVGVDADWWRIC
jgi:hypothetical protein